MKKVVTSVALLSIAFATAAWAAKPATTTSTGGIRVYAGSKYIGVLFWANSDYGRSTILSDKGYLFGVYKLNGDLEIGDDSVYFSNTNCTGDAYVQTGENAWKWAHGYVLRAGTSIFYSPKRSTSGQNEVASSYNYGGCENFTGFTLDSVPLLPNDPTVTGVSGIAMGGMISFGAPL